MLSLEDMVFALQDVGTASGSFETEANVTVAKEDFIDELSGDGLNDERYDYRETRHVVHIPTVPATASVAEPANVCHVPICKAEMSSTFHAAIPVVKNVALTGNKKRNNRMGGNFAASVLSTVSADGSDFTSSPIPGILTRVAQAILCSETGATPAPAPNIDGWDVRVAPLSNSATFRNLYLGHTPVFLPPRLGKPEAQALISLCLPGGAASYGWRFRPIDGITDPRADLMPAYSRKLYPGGEEKILVIVESPQLNWTFGGKALTPDALKRLEGWLRNRFGQNMVDAAFKTAAAMGHVYVEPGATADSLGRGFNVVQATRMHGGIDLGGPTCSWDISGVHPGIAVTRQPETDIKHRPNGLDNEVVNAMRALLAPGVGAGDAIPVPASAGRPVYDEEANVVCLDWRVGKNQHRHANVAYDAVLIWLADEANGMAVPIRRFANNAMQAYGGDLGLLYTPADRDESNVELEGFRNSFGYNDKAVFALPEFDLRAVVPALAGVHIVNAQYGHQSGLNRGNRRDRLRHYIAKMHIAHIVSVTGANIWPDILGFRGYGHKELVVKMPKGLQPLAYLEGAGRHLLSAPNWQILEVVSRLKGTRNTTAYHGYNVPGSWEVDAGGCVDLNKSSTNIAALDAAMRSTWLWGGMIDIISPRAGNFSVVRDICGYSAPLGFAPIIQYHRPVGVSIASGCGADFIGAGSNHSTDMVMAC